LPDWSAANALALESPNDAATDTQITDRLMRPILDPGPKPRDQRFTAGRRGKLLPQISGGSARSDNSGVRPPATVEATAMAIARLVAGRGALRDSTASGCIQDGRYTEGRHLSAVEALRNGRSIGVQKQAKCV
jgi:hypothetical protein